MDCHFQSLHCLCGIEIQIGRYHEILFNLRKHAKKHFPPTTTKISKEKKPQLEPKPCANKKETKKKTQATTTTKTNPGK